LGWYRNFGTISLRGSGVIFDVPLPIRQMLLVCAVFGFTKPVSLRLCLRMMTAYQTIAQTAPILLLTKQGRTVAHAALKDH
jgi:hypothetical protein